MYRQSVVKLTCINLTHSFHFMLKLPSLHFTLLEWKLLELNHKMTMFLAQNNYPDLYHLQGGINYEIDPPNKFC